MRVALTGSHGLIARHLRPALEAAGHTVVPLVRSGARPGEVAWDPAAGTIDTAALEGVDAAIHLAGAGLLRRWSAKGKRQILDSRVQGTTLLAKALASLPTPPGVLLSASAVGYYGWDGGDAPLTEDSPSGGGFLAQVTREWEAATAPASDAGIRTVHLRTGIVQAGEGGALHAQLLPFKAGLGARLGHGRQWVPWISIDDEVGAILHALATPGLTGPLNLTAPNPVTNAEYAKALGRALRRPALLAVPGAAISLALGSQMAHEMLLGGQRALPSKLEASGYPFRHRTIDEALAAVLA